jgi:NitT/TauT family transport system permease protein
VRGVVWWRRVILPELPPSIATGAIAASGGAWNTAIVAEFAQWGDTTLIARGGCLGCS